MGKKGMLVGAAETSERLAEWRRLQQKNLGQNGPAENGSKKKGNYSPTK